jgi:hypothetical protein
MQGAEFDLVCADKIMDTDPRIMETNSNFFFISNVLLPIRDGQFDEMLHVIGYTTVEFYTSRFVC